MKYPKDRNIHRPPHIYWDNTDYFISVNTVNWRPIFNDDNKKSLLLCCIRKALKKYNYTCESWVILNDHYQITIKTKIGRDLGLFIKQINGSSSRQVNLIDGKIGCKVWDEYWDEILGNERSYWTHVNYIHHNPIKHGYVKNMKEYIWSSLNDHIIKYGEEAVYERFEYYPIIDYTNPNEN